MKTAHRSIEQLIEEQAHKWALMRKEARERPDHPVIAISRLSGAGAGKIALQVAEDLGFDLFGRQIIQKVAEDAHLSAAVVETLDEKKRNTLEEWLLSGVSGRFLWSEEYLRHLAKVVGTAAKHGRAVLLGRGVSFLLPTKECLRVLIVAPLAVRIQNAMRGHNIAEAEARDRIHRIDGERRVYVKKYFHADFMDPTQYDLVLNTEALDVRAATETIKAAWKSRQAP